MTDLLGGGSTTTNSTEISLDSLGGIDQVNVDFGGAPSSLGSSSPSTSNVKTEVLNEFDRIASSADSSSSSPSSSPKPASAEKPANSYSFF